MAELIAEQNSFEVVPYNSMMSIRSPDALAIWVYLLAKPEDWTIRRADVMARFDIGKHRYQTAMKILRKAGLIETRSLRGPKGRIIKQETWCLAMPLKPRKRRAAQLDSRPSGIKPTRSLKQDRVITQDRGDKQQPTKVGTRLPEGTPLKEAVATVRRRTRKADAEKVKQDTPTNAIAAAAWNDAMEEFFPNSPKVKQSQMRSSAFVLRNSIKTITLASRGQWKDILRYSIKNWSYLKHHKFKWMRTKPMPDHPAYEWWQWHFGRFAQEYAASREAKDGLETIQFTQNNPDVVKHLQQQIAALEKENRRIHEESKKTVLRERKARTRILDRTAQLEKENVKLKRRTRRVVSLDEPIESWEDRDA